MSSNSSRPVTSSMDMFRKPGGRGCVAHHLVDSIGFSMMEIFLSKGGNAEVEEGSALPSSDLRQKICSSPFNKEIKLENWAFDSKWQCARNNLVTPRSGR
jgi:hypothetical protein